MDEYNHPSRLDTLLSGTAAEHLFKPQSFSLRRHTQGTEHTRASSTFLSDFQEGHKLSASGDLVRSRRAPDAQRSRLSTNSRPSPLSRDNGTSSSPAPNEDDAHISVLGQRTARHPSPFRLMQTTEGQPDVPQQARSGSSMQLRSRKSLHQRLDGGGGNTDADATDDSHSVNMQNDERRRHSHFEYNHAKLPTRSESVASSAYGRVTQDEDISSIMMRGATDLRNAKFENEEQRREITFLQSQLQVAMTEKEEVLKRLQAVKASAKHGLEATSKSLDGVRSALDGLKAQASDVFAFATQAKVSLPDVQELRTTVQETVKAIEPLFNESGHLYKIADTKNMMNELQSECTRAHQVADLLRERLQSLGSELVEAKARVTEVENAQAADRDALRISNACLSNTTNHIKELVEQISIRRTEVQDALVAGGELEIKLQAAEKHIMKLQETVESLRDELTHKSDIERENSKLSVQLSERESRLAELESVQERLEAAISLSNEHCTRIRLLEMQVASKDESIADLNGRIVQEQSTVQELQSTLQNLKHDLGSARTREESLQQEVARAKAEQTQLKQGIQTVNDALEEVKKELEARMTTMHEMNTRCQVLEDRIEGQMVSLRISKETISTLQDRLAESETKSARDLEAAVGRLNCQIAVAEEQKSGLQDKLTALEGSMRAAQDNEIQMKAEYEGKLMKQEEAHRMQLDLARQHNEDVHKALEDARSTIKSLEEQVSAGRQEVLALRDELREAKLPSAAHKEAIDTLTTQLTAFREEKMELILRARSIDSRYRAGDLNEEEKVFINTLILTSQSGHEQDLIAKGNELKRRDNTIKELQSRIHLLETTLAKHLKSVNKATVSAGNEKASLIDPAAWVPSSEKRSSPIQSAQPEDDRPSVNVDNTITAKSTPAPKYTGALGPLSTVPVPVPNAMVRPLPALRPHTGAATARSTPAHMKKAPATVQFAPEKSSPLVYPSPKVPVQRLKTYKTIKATAQSAKPGFRRLDTDRSDEIADFDDLTPYASPLTDVSGDAKTKLGKRDRVFDTKSPGAGRQAKKLRTGARTRSITQQQGNADSPIIESPEPLGAKSRTRKRH